MVSAVSTKIGSKVDLLYPSRGYRNVLRRVRGELLEKVKVPTARLLLFKRNQARFAA